MRINGLCASCAAFKGRVFQNYYKTVDSISNCPKSTHESLIGNINTLKSRLENLTPQDKRYYLDFDYESKQESKFDPTYHYAVISVRDADGNLLSNKFSLGKSGGSHKTDRTELASGGDIWNNGFREITEKSLANAFEHNEEEYDVAKVCKDRHWRVKSAGLIIKMIADKIEPRAKVKINRAETAASLLTVTKDCPDEILESIIENINELTYKLDEQSAKQKSYDFVVTNSYEALTPHGFYKGFSDNWLDIIVSAKNSTHRAEQQRETMYIKDEEDSYCITDGLKIYDENFKPLTNKLLWDSYNNLPLQKDYEKSSILDRLS